MEARMRIVVVWSGGQIHKSDTAREPRRSWPAARRLAWRRALELIRRERQEPVAVVLSGMDERAGGGGDTVVTRADVLRGLQGEDVDLAMCRVVA